MGKSYTYEDMKGSKKYLPDDFVGLTNELRCYAVDNTHYTTIHAGEYWQLLVITPNAHMIAQLVPTYIALMCACAYSCNTHVLES